ncbi:aldehyde dehydrogenase family protein [Paenibacillus silvae]|uniref:aldehyde dehydrogenase family protein n=1 Tax=Paenibacillus silvae TaxID=1325358 RepID=UPI0020043659|nr:aldehyde dehydrogenase family protein [Paenibacillus silvae]MCK6073945.1 aldehyde dehydrogenase family protein [Paenibacillus silvae]MCK6148577.1 aldehyde dehydrogenase family protein [Paenibacillus silvae]MCK6266879.1 aldehyde dehydrogenase family protein [Paenibacillus silvae]
MTLMDNQRTAATWTKQYISGKWVDGTGEKMLENINPYTDEVIAVWRSSSKEDIDRAYQSAKKSAVEWKAALPSVKEGVLRKMSSLMDERKEEIIRLLITESGSTRIKAEAEFAAAKRVVDESASFPFRMKGELLPSNTPGKENRVLREPKGVVGVIGPWNFPLHLCLRSVAPAIALGNGVVIKPASDTPITAGWLIADLFEQAGLPEGVLNVVAGSGSEIGDYFVTHPVPKVISFTGSTEVGRGIGKLAGEQLKETALELGGNNAMIVLEDADIEHAAQAAVFGKFLHQGQICMALNRIIVHANIYDRFLQSFVDKAKNIQAGDPADPSTLVGPLIRQKEVERLLKLVKQAEEEGAKLLLGGTHEQSVLQPTVLADVKPDQEIVQQELFGPVALIMKAKDEQQAIELANNTPYGLSGSVFTTNLERGYHAAQQIESGMVHVNDQSVNDEAHVMFGGEKSSGIGRFGGDWAIDKFTRTRWISLQHQHRDYPGVK